LFFWGFGTAYHPLVWNLLEVFIKIPALFSFQACGRIVFLTQLKLGVTTWHALAKEHRSLPGESDNVGEGPAANPQ